MASRNNKKKTVPVYSADTLALRFVLGMLLIAVGVCIFLATDLGMGAKNGGVFQIIDGFFRGVFGVTTMIVPAFFIWGGILVILASQRPVHPKPFFWSLLAFFGICTMINLCSGDGTRAVFEYFSDWTGALQSPMLKQGGGAFGALLGWPMYSVLGIFLSCVITALGTLAAIAMAVGMTPSRIRELLSGRQPKQPDPREDRERLAWQQQQEQQRIAAQEQQAEYARQQQMMMQQYQQQQAAYTDTRAGYTNGVEGFTDAVTTSRAANSRQNGNRQSAIFNRKAGSETVMESRPERKSRIFNRREKDDGLSDTPASNKRAYGRPETVAPVQEEQPVQPEQPHNFSRPSYAEQVEERRRNTPAVQERSEPNADSEAIPENVPVSVRTRKRRGEEEPEQNTDERVSVNIRKTGRRTAGADRTDNGTVSETINGHGDTQDRPVHPEEPEEKPVPVTNVTPVKQTEEPAATRPIKHEQKTVPEVQMTVGISSYKPDLNLPPKEKEEAEEEEYWEPTPYNYPRITLLKQPAPSKTDSEEDDLQRAKQLEETLAAFKVSARVVNVTHGPAISRFELELATGIKVSKVQDLEKDIACGMQATTVRIEAPIPGTNLVGVEIPNPERTTVTLRELLESAPMQNAKSMLTVALGKDIAGKPIVCDLAKMPHLLIAGATGSGKSVCINTIINSLIYRTSPDEVKLILVDPKVVELKCYNGIPHLLIPVVNEPRKAATALAWAVAEMMERYDKFAQTGVRNLEGYNDKLKPNQKPMPRIVVIIDELADLMMTCKKEVEDYICRLTQLARAAGIHLIVATQRPSVDVITGLIKANIPSRIAFKTASYVDSRTILDRNGSEQLLGWGDMLYLPTGEYAPIRVQGCFVSDAEVLSITDEVRRANPSTYDPDVLNKLEELGQEREAPQTMDMIGGAPESTDVDADLFEQCVEMAIQDGQISTSTLQRRLKLGYSRAGRLTDQLEERGIISAKDGSKPRKCLITREEWEEMRRSTEDM